MTEPTPALFRPGLAAPAEGSASAPVVVAIDGPAGSGKSSVSKAAAARLGYGFLDTGAAYRALAWHALAHEADTSDATAVLEVFGDFEYAISLDPADRWVRVGGTDVTAAIREPRVTDAVSGVARVAPVRHAVNELFRRLVASAVLRASWSKAATSPRSCSPTRPCASS